MTMSIGGVAIWCMHFVGMSAVTLYSPAGEQLQVGFRLDLTLVSLVVVLALTYLGLYIGTRDKSFMMDKSDIIDGFVAKVETMSIAEIRHMKHANVFLGSALFSNLLPFAVGGVFIATGVCVMHYIGMMAMVFDGTILWDAGIVAASVLIALVAATAALWIMFRLLAMFPNIELLRVACAVVAAVAVNGMHYTGMAAATFRYFPNKPKDFSSPVTGSNEARIGAIIAAVVFICLVFIIAVSDLRVWYHNLSKIYHELDSTLEGALNEESRAKREAYFRGYCRLRDQDGAFKAVSEFKAQSKNYAAVINRSSFNCPTPKSIAGDLGHKSSRIAPLSYAVGSSPPPVEKEDLEAALM